MPIHYLWAARETLTNEVTARGWHTHTTHCQHGRHSVSTRGCGVVQHQLFPACQLGSPSPPPPSLHYPASSPFYILVIPPSRIGFLSSSHCLYFFHTPSNGFCTYVLSEGKVRCRLVERERRSLFELRRNYESIVADVTPATPERALGPRFLILPL